MEGIERYFNLDNMLDIFDSYMSNMMLVLKKQNNIHVFVSFGFTYKMFIYIYFFTFSLKSDEDSYDVFHQEFSIP